MIGTFNIKLHAANPNLPLPRLFAFVGSPSNVRIVDAPRKIGSWSLTKVYLLANYPDNTSRSVEATLDGGCWHATLPACSVVGVSAVGFRVTADGVSEDGTTSVTGYVLGAGDLEILSTDGTVTVGETTYYAHILDTQPTTPHKGDMCVIDGVWKLYNGSAWISLGGVAEVDWANITNKPSTFTPSSHAATHGSSGTDPITPTSIGAETSGAAASAVSTHDASASAHATLLADKLDSSSGDASVAWNDDGNLAVSGGKFVGSFDGEFMAAAWNDYKIDLGGGETADLPEELAVQIGNHNTASDAHSAKFAEKAAQTPTFTEAATRANLAGSGEAQETMWGKVKKVITDFIAHLTDAAAHSSLFALKANVSDFTIGSFASYVSSLFSSDNTSNNLDNIRTSAASSTPASTHIDSTKRYTVDTPTPTAPTVADTYAAGVSYAVGDHVIVSNVAYVCTTAVATSTTWATDSASFAAFDSSTATAYAISTAYAVGASVTYGGNNYLCIAAVTTTANTSWSAVVASFIGTVHSAVAVADFTINTVDSSAKDYCNITFPAARSDGKARDFIIRYICGVAPTFPAGITVESDTAFAEWEFTVGKTYYMSFTETASGVWLGCLKEIA